MFGGHANSLHSSTNLSLAVVVEPDIHLNFSACLSQYRCSALSRAKLHSCPASCWHWQADAVAHTLQAVGAPRPSQQPLLLTCGRGAAHICVDACAATLCCPGAEGWQSASLRCCLQPRKVLLASALTHVTSGVHSTDPERASSACAPIRDLHLDRNRHCVHGVL
jgi:hypothetical protein